MRASLIAVAIVWGLGCVWSYQEQSAFAASKGFAFPHLLPLVIDGFAVSMAGVSWAASLDARPAIPARLATVLAVGASSASNGVWAYLRTRHDMVTVVLGVAVPIAANLAFEVLLAELRRQVQRRRGLPPPVAVPYPRLIRLFLAPFQTFRAWRSIVLELTSMDRAVNPASNPSRAQPEPVQATATTEPYSAERTGTPAAALPERATREPDHAAPAALAGPVPTPTEHTEPSYRAPASTPQQPARHAEPPARSTRLDHSEPGTPLPHSASHQGDPIRTTTNGAPQPVSPAPLGRAQAPHPASAPVGAPVVATAPTNGHAAVNPPVARSLEAEPTARSASPAPAPPARPAGPKPAPAARKRVGSPAPTSPAADTEESDGSRGLGRPVDQRVERLAQHLATAEDGDELTGERVAQLLGIDVAPRTGRRLLGQARELLNQRMAGQSDADDELSVIGGR
jgi:hypothetical protein